MRDLHLAYLRAGIPNQDVPQDHVFFASLYRFATENGIGTIFSGGNLATEGYSPYDKAEAIAEMELTFGYKPYDRKHGESLFTKLFQNYYLPTRFGYDKRLPHYSSLIVSGQMSRDEALAKLKEPLYDLRELETDITYFCKKLRISRQEFEALMSAPVHHSDFPTWESSHRLAKKAQAVIERVLGRRVAVYS